MRGGSAHRSLTAALVAVSVFTEVGRSSAFSSEQQQPPPPGSTPILFPKFQFAPNGVSVRPSAFFCQDLEGEDGGIRRSFSLRNVPGTGDCVFQAVALATATSMGLGGNDALLRSLSSETRNVVAQVLAAGEGNLHVGGRRLVPARKLLRSAARDLGLEPEEYLSKLRKTGSEGGLYGGGPDLTVLANVLRRPLSVYELHEEELDQASKPNADNMQLPKECRIKCAGVFGDIFKDPCLKIPDSAVLSGLQPGAYSWHLHILIVDSNSKEKHACVLLPDFCNGP